MKNNFIGILGFDKKYSVDELEKIILQTNAQKDQGNIQMNIIIDADKDHMEQNIKNLKNIDSKEIFVSGAYDKAYAGKLSEQYGIRISDFTEHADEIIRSYRNDL